MTIQLKGMSFSQTGLETLKKRKYKRNKEKKAVLMMTKICHILYDLSYPNNINHS